MLFILFQIGRERYALSATSIIQVLPLMSLKKIPCAPTAVAGVLNYHGAPVPVIDLNEMTLAKAAARRSSTRIILVNYLFELAYPQPLGLIVQHATSMMRCSIQDFVETGVRSDAAPYLGRVTHDSAGLIQWIEIERLLTPELRNVLFRELACS
jgi:chemotaxis-related protein WspB